MRRYIFNNFANNVVRSPFGNVVNAKTNNISKFTPQYTSALSDKFHIKRDFQFQIPERHLKPRLIKESFNKLFNKKFSKFKQKTKPRYFTFRPVAL